MDAGSDGDGDTDSDADAGNDSGGDADCGADKLWVVTFGSALDDYGMDVELDDEGNVFFCGYYGGLLDFAGTPLPFAGSLDVVVAKLSRSGRLRWVSTVGGPGEEREPGIAVDRAGNVALATEYSAAFELDGRMIEHYGQSDLLLVKYTPDGAVSWVRTFGGPGQEFVPRIAFDSEGDLFLVAEFEGTVDFDEQRLTASDSEDLVIARLDGTNGAVLWAKSYGGFADESAYAIVADPSGDVAVTGWFANNIDFGGGMLSPGGAFVAKIAGADGTHRWSKVLTNGENESGCGLALTASGDVFVSGWFQGELDFGGGTLAAVDFTDLWVARYDAATGAHRWSRSFGGPLVDSSCTAATTINGDVVIGGYYTREIDFGGGPLDSPFGGFFARLSGADGAHVWSHAISGPGGENVANVAIRTDDLVVITGDFSETLTFFGEPMESHGQSDGFIVSVPAHLLTGGER